MDVNVNVKKSKSRKRKRHSKVKRREQARLEVRFAKRRKLVAELNVHAGGLKNKDKLTKNSMQANTFWVNYEAAHEWQRRHSVEWWKSRCVALEQENSILRDKIRELVSNSTKQTITVSPKKNITVKNIAENLKYEKEVEVDEYEEGDSDHENLEFQVNEEMMEFFEKSIRHKLELKEKRDVEFAMEKAEQELEEDVHIHGGAAWMQAKTNAAKLLYGVSSPRILAMETALQATMDRHKDRAKPQYWPNIPLNL